MSHSDTSLASMSLCSSGRPRYDVCTRVASRIRPSSAIPTRALSCLNGGDETAPSKLGLCRAAWRPRSPNDGRVKSCAFLHAVQPASPRYSRPAFALTECKLQGRRLRRLHRLRRLILSLCAQTAAWSPQMRLS
jgi:hypothetical protein